MNQSLQEARRPIQRTISSEIPALTSVDTILVGSVPAHVVEQKDMEPSITGLIKVIASLILAIIFRFAYTGTLVSPIDSAADSSADQGGFTTTPRVDLMDLSTAGF